MTKKLTASEGGKGRRRGDEAPKKVRSLTRAEGEGEHFCDGSSFPFFIVSSARGVGGVVAAAADRLVGK